MNFLAQAFVSSVCFTALLHVSVGQSDSQCMVDMGKCTMVYKTATAQRFGNVNGLVELCSKRQEVLDCLNNVEGGQECMSAVNTVKANIEDLLVKSKVCEKIGEIEKYSECFSKPDITSRCPPKNKVDPENMCENLEEDTMCLAKRVKDICGEKQSEVMYFLSRAIARNIANAQGKTCSGLGTNSVDKLVSVSMVVLGLLSLFVGTLAVN
ncbi:uncharacterized protein LOC135462791 [Liolophura sinensis]|uniref:uncharacterized protein LOC135462791 n=1 Tax=Liolophura sinensis TaxID=3198878 RepID=UPI00315880E9